MTGLADPGATLGALVLAGGRSRRFGGTDKTRLRLDGVPLVERAVSAVRDVGIASCVVVGPPVPVLEVPVVQEQPAHGGPVAAVAAGLTALRAGATTGTAATIDGDVLVIACDLHRPELAVALLAAVVLGPEDGVHLLDPAGHPQWLAARYRLTALDAALARLGDPTGRAMHALASGLSLRSLPAPAAATADLDTWEDLRRARGEEPR